MKRVHKDTELLASETRMLNDIEAYYADIKRIYLDAIKRYSVIEKYTDLFLKRDESKGVPYYLVRRKGEKKGKYQGKEDDKLVVQIQEARYCKKLIDVLREDIKLIENFLKKFKSASFQSITENLPKAYRNKKAFAARSKEKIAKKWKEEAEAYKATKPIIREHELTQPTIDGNYVRKKCEALIYNYLYENGYTFVYELPLEAEGRVFYPDFTILSEIDYHTLVRIEHQGMMGDEGYESKAEVREADYWKCGYLPNRDVYFTYDDNKGATDIRPIIEILRSRVRPCAD